MSLFSPCALAANSNFRALFAPILEKAIPDILAAQDQTTGRWGKGPVVITEQNVIYPLAVAWSQRFAGNHYYHDPKLLEAMMRGGDFLISQQKADGEWVFRTKNGGEWGDIYMPWTYSRWIRTYGLIRDAMPADERTKWEKALRLGFDGIASKKLHGDLHFIENIPTHHAMALWLAGKLLDRPGWSRKAADYLHKAIASQDPAGFWTENLGPVVNYNFVYMDAIGTYYAMSHDPVALPALMGGTAFHANFTYPNGRRVETIDERNAYDSEIDVSNVGFTFSPLGRAFILQQFNMKRAYHELPGPDVAASFILYAQDGPIGKTQADRDHQFILGQNDAMVVRKNPWFVCLSAYHAPVPQDRWIQDRQNFLSIYNDYLGLIAGGGNTKLTPFWSTFTAGDVKLLSHHPGETNPSYVEPAGLFHVPGDLKLLPGLMTLLATYGPAHCSMSVKIEDDSTVRITYRLLNNSALPVAAHLTLLPQLDRRWTWGDAMAGRLDLHPLHFISHEPQTFSHHGWRVDVPAGASVDWPVLPYDQYVKDGTAPLDQGRIVVTLPLGKTPAVRSIRYVGD